MSIRRFNYTGRKRIRRQDAVVLAATGETPEFDVELSLADYELPPDAKVIVEAYRQTSLRRYRFGRVSEPRPEEPLDLSGLPEIEDLRFRVKVVDTDDVGRLLAEADRLPLVDLDRGTSPSLVHVREADLGGELWRLTYEDDTPILLVERKYGPREMLLSSPHFRWLVLPQLFRQLLTDAIDMGGDDDDENEASWSRQVVEHATRLAGVEPPSSDEAEQARGEWMTSAVKAFCRRHGFARRYSAQVFPMSAT
jgi:hypothetical protein